jgi:hypothetical protein
MQTRRVTFIHAGGADMASYRLRAAMPSAYCGYHSRLNARGADITVFSKPQPDDLVMFEQVQARGAKAVVDICDDHFLHPKLGEIYAEMARKADAVVCPSKEMARRIHEYVQKEAHVIPDTWENSGQPHADGEKFLWLGHQSNLNEILPYKQMLQRYDMAYCTGPNDVIECIPWSSAAQEDLLRQRNVVILPSKEEAYKSANRLINAIMAGCFVIASKIVINKEFRHFCYLGPVKGGLQFVQAYKSELNALVRAGQQYIQQHYSPETLGRKWQSVFDSI